MPNVNRIVVVGSSGSGKTSVARRLADALGYECLELDSVYHREGWDSTPDEVFKREIASFITRDAWVVDGNYTSHGVGELVWPLADTIVWMDTPRATVLRRVVTRTLKRLATREKLWGRVTEPWTNLYSLDPQKNIIVWAWTRFDHVQEKFEAAQTDGSWAHAAVHRLRSRDEIDSFFAGIVAGSEKSEH